MLSFIKKLFAKEDVQTLPVSELEGWLRAKEQELLQELSSDREAFAREYARLLENVGGAAGRLEAAKLRNEHIPIRERQFMQGNRDAYLLKLRLLLGGLGKEPGEKDFEKILLEFTSSTQRSGTILQEFFAHEVRDVTLALKHLHLHMTHPRKEEKALNMVRALLAQHEAVLHARKRKEELASEQERLLQGIREGEEQLKSILLQKDAFLRSPAYLRWEQEREGLKAVDTDLAALKADFSLRISSLSRALRKYEHIALEHTEWISAYLDDAFSALLADHDLHLLSILSGLRKQLPSFSLKNEEKIGEIIDALDEAYVLGVVDAYASKTDERLALADSVEGSSVQGTLDELEEKIISQQRLLERQRQDARSQEAVDPDALEEALCREVESCYPVRAERAK